MKNIKIRLLKIYYAPVCFLTDFIKGHQLKKHKIFIGTLILYDLIVYKYPNETDRKIIEVQRRKLKWVKKESKMIFCISESTKKDAKEILGIEDKRLKVIYPGI